MLDSLEQSAFSDDTMSKDAIFVSYAHEDKKWLDLLETFLTPWLRERHWGVWTDRGIEAGAKWEKEIKQAMRSAHVAVLLVSKDFLASKFIAEVELPALLKREKTRKLRLIPIAVSPAEIKASPLKPYQFANSPERPLTSMRGANRDRALVKIARQINDALTIAGLAHGLGVIDETAESLEARVEKRPARMKHRHRVRASLRADQEHIAFTSSQATITYDDLEKLSDEDREYIADLEDTMRRQYERWRQVRTKLGAAGGAMDGEIEGELTRIGKLMCADLTAILDFLREMLKYDLEDHYGRYRHICQQLQTA